MGMHVLKGCTMVRAPLLALLLWLVWQQECTCTSNGHIPSISWEAARAAAKAAYERNLRLAGLIGRASPAIPPALPGLEHLSLGPAPAAEKGASGPLPGPGSMQTHQNVSVILHGGPEVAESGKLGQRNDSGTSQPALNTSGAKPVRPQQLATGAKAVAEIADTVQHNRTAISAPAAYTVQQEAFGLWVCRLLLTHVVCLLLGWLLRGGTVQHRAAQVCNDGSGLTRATASSESFMGDPLQPPSGSHRSSQPRSSKRQCTASSKAKQQHKHGDGMPNLPGLDMAQTLSKADVFAEVQAVAGASTSKDDADRPCTNNSDGTAVLAGDASLQLSSDRHNRKAGKPGKRGILLRGRRRKPSGFLRGSCTDRRAAAISQDHVWQTQQQQEQEQAAPEAPSARSLVSVHRSQSGRHPLQVVITAGPEAVHSLVPAMRVLQQLATGVHTLSVMSTGVVHHAQQLSSGIINLTSRLDSLLGWAKKQDQQQLLAAQQLLGHNAAQLGLSLLLLAVGVTALRVGRVWEVHQVCVEKSQGFAGSWQQRLTGTRHVTSLWLYTSCCGQELGLYAAGLGVLYWLAKASWMSLLMNSTRANQTSKSWQLDVLVLKGVVCAIAGAHIMHCLGAAWAPWLLLWWLWCSMQVMLQTHMLRTPLRLLLVLAVSLMLPLTMALAPFHSRGILLQGWLIDVLPVLGRLPNLRQLLPAW